MITFALALVVAFDVSAAAVDVERVPHWYKPDPPITAVEGADTKPQRIVSLAPVITETLFLLGEGDHVVGVTRFCDRPAAATALPQVGGYSDASLEKILALKPDLVIAMPNLGQRQLLDRLRERHVRVYVAFTDSLDETDAMMRGLGALFRKPAVVDALLAARAATFAPIAAHKVAKGKRVVVVVGHDPLVVAGKGSFADSALALVGADSALLPTDPQWPQWSLEALLSRKVDVVVAAEGEDGAKQLRAQLQALGPRAPKVVSAKDPILMRPGPSFVDDVTALEKLLQ